MSIPAGALAHLAADNPRAQGEPGDAYQFRLRRLWQREQLAHARMLLSYDVTAEDVQRALLSVLDALDSVLPELKP